MTSIPLDHSGIPQSSSFLDASQKRIERLRSELPERNLDAVYIRNTSNIEWLTAFQNVFDEERAHAIIATADQVILHTDSRYSTSAEAAAEGGMVEVSSERKSHCDLLVDLIDVGTRVAIEDSISLHEFRLLEKAIGKCDKQIELVETEVLVEMLREVKDDLEITLMRKAQAITDSAFAHIVDYIRPGMSEVQVQRELDSFMFEAGASGLAFPTIVATGVHAASPHAIPDSRQIQIGEAVVMDFGARFGGYCSDMTRTVFIGEPSKRMKAAYETIRDANEQCENALCAGKTGAEIHQLAEDILTQHGFASTMGHGLGHSLGIDIHENPSLAPRNKEPLSAGVVVTVEPGIYLPGQFGMRLEDFGVVTERGFQVITQSSHDMVIIDPLSR